MAGFGAKVALSARNCEALEEIAIRFPPGQCLVIPFDVTEPKAHFSAAKQIMERWDGLDTVFLNAGISTVETFSGDQCTRMMQTNFLGMAYGIEAALPLLRKSSDPHLVGMSSIAAYIGMPQLSVYCATKSACRTLLQGLRMDFKPEGIKVTIVCPGFVKTPMTDRHDFMMPFLLNVEDAARIIVAGIARQKAAIVFPAMVSIVFKLLSCLPESTSSRLLNWLAPTHIR
ncbi:SDR family oxidoreductase [Endozoicomonas sp. SCSIO W0465]|uniref:SDR family NAD(P)-dependent oxidoreductase n=1 Tax=Endozoicomonas sp. SCSIO W0465 TaxID=2918516 RepID=UPI0020754835|nr:SDR family NAD(P)-dependent oxidoreductase [Endozoicomonas sp. SCSIO W0465]USE39850.1 SDR family NAD(P)-dependent oxidoreductase [Endozoicomonas sp. SCSIO W0465]